MIRPFLHHVRHLATLSLQPFSFQDNSQQLQEMLVFIEQDFPKMSLEQQIACTQKMIYYEQFSGELQREAVQRLTQRAFSLSPAQQVHALQVVGEGKSEGGKRLQMLVERQVLRTLPDYEGHQIVSLVRRLSLLQSTKTLDKVVASVLEKESHFQKGEVIRVLQSVAGSTYQFEEQLLDRICNETLAQAAQLTTQHINPEVLIVLSLYLALAPNNPHYRLQLGNTLDSLQKTLAQHETLGDLASVTTLLLCYRASEKAIPEAVQCLVSSCLDTHLLHSPPDTLFQLYSLYHPSQPLLMDSLFTQYLQTHVHELSSQELLTFWQFINRHPLHPKAPLLHSLLAVCTSSDLSTCVHLFCLCSESSLSCPSLSEATLSLLPRIESSLEQSVVPVPLSLLNRVHKVIISLLHKESPLLDRSIYLPFLTRLLSSSRDKLFIDDAQQYLHYQLSLEFYSSAFPTHSSLFSSLLLSLEAQLKTSPLLE